MIEDELGENNGGKEGQDVDREDRLFGEGLIRVENGGDKDDRYEKREKFREEVVWIFPEDETIVEAPEEHGGKSDFYVFPSAFVNSGEEADDFVMTKHVIKEVKETAEGED